MSGTRSLHPPPRLVSNLADCVLLIGFSPLVLPVLVHGTAFVCSAMGSSGVAFLEAEDFEFCRLSGCRLGSGRDLWNECSEWAEKGGEGEELTVFESGD